MTWVAPLWLITLGAIMATSVFYFEFVYPFSPGGMSSLHALGWFSAGCLLSLVPIGLFLYFMGEAFGG